MGLFGAQAVCQNLVNLYLRRGVVSGQLDEEVGLEVRYVFALSFCRLLMIIKYMLYVLLFDVLFDLSVRQNSMVKLKS